MEQVIPDCAHEPKQKRFFSLSEAARTFLPFQRS